MSLLRLLLLCAVLCGCASRTTPPTPMPSATPASTPAPGPSPLDPLAERYVKLVLAVGGHDRNYVDAYYGPPAWAEEAKALLVPLPTLAASAAELVQEVEATPVPADPLLAMRRRFLATQTRALEAFVRFLSGERLGFDAESRALYDAQAPQHTEADFETVLKELDALLPAGEGGLAARLERFRLGFAIPEDKLEPVFQTAIAEARRRTLAHVALPAHEAFSLELVTDKPWSGYNWYKGNATSLIQVNKGLPVFVWRAIDLAAHEGYPGHHVYNALLEQHLVRERGWVELTVYPLYSPMSLIAEGSANYGIDVAFPDAERYLREVLFPLAGLDPAGAAAYARVERVAGKLSYAANEAARRYLDRTATREQARDWLVRYGLMSPERAAQRLAFIATVRAYVINYNLGRDMVAGWVERQGGTPDNPRRRWELFQELLRSPRLPADLR